MADTPPEEPFEDLADLDDAAVEVGELVADLREQAGASLRLAVRYTADDYDVLFAREDVAGGFTEAELEERVETLVMKGLGDPPQEGALFDFGTLEATLRFYDNTLVAHFPYREWSGLVLTLDRTASPLVDLVDEHL